MSHQVETTSATTPTAILDRFCLANFLLNHLLTTDQYANPVLDLEHLETLMKKIVKYPSKHMRCEIPLLSGGWITCYSGIDTTGIEDLTLNICFGEKEEEEFLLNDASVVKMSVMSVSLVWEQGTRESRGLKEFSWSMTPCADSANLKTR